MTVNTPAPSQKSKIASLIKNEMSPQKDYAHLSNFLRQHITRKKAGKSASIEVTSTKSKGDALSVTASMMSKGSQRFNNQLIERASQEIATRKQMLKTQGEILAATDKRNNKDLQNAFITGGAEITSNPEAPPMMVVDPNDISDRKSTLTN